MLKKIFSVFKSKPEFKEERYDEIEEEVIDEYFMDTDDPTRL
jgi:predicted alternative tryptophan synthase beta-subunit